MSKTILSQFPKENNDYRRGAGYYIPITLLAILFLAGFVFLGYFTMNLIDMAFEKEVSIAEPLKIIEEPVIKEEITQEVIEEIVEEVIEEEPEPVVHLTDDDILAAVAMSEAGNQDVLGMAFVIMTVLNRCDYYDATVESIVSAPHQYAYPYYGKISDNAYLAIKLAREYRNTFPPIAWFQTGDYSAYGEPAFKWGDHYFSYIAESEGE